MHGCDTVFHVAGVNAMCLRDPNAMFRTNVDGSASVVRAAARAGVTRVVFTSSAATIGEPRGVVGTEDVRAPRHVPLGVRAIEVPGGATRARARHRAGRGGRLREPVVRPRARAGPRAPPGCCIGLVNARLPVVVETFLSIVDVDDCTKGHLAAETRGRPGERYLLSGASLTTTRAIALVQAAAGRPRHVVRVPRAVAPVAGAAAGWAARLMRRDLPFCTRARADAAARAPLRRLPGHEGAGTRSIGRSRRPSLGPSPGTRSEG